MLIVKSEYLRIFSFCGAMLIAFFINPDAGSAQGKGKGKGGGKGGGPPCNPIVVDLSGNPDSNWTIKNQTPDSKNCCSGNGAYNKGCVQFSVTLDQNAIGLIFESSGPSSNDRSYSINCGSFNHELSDTICLSGAKSYTITYCKNGKPSFDFEIQSIAKPEIRGDKIVNKGCSGVLQINNLVTSSIRWRSVSDNPTYNSFLSCDSACDSTQVSPQDNFPDSIQYTACGVPAYPCFNDTLCDTLTVNFNQDLEAEINPKSGNLPCPGEVDSITLEASASNGNPPYQFRWNTGASGKEIKVDSGTYIVVVSDRSNCPPAFDTFRYDSTKRSKINSSGIMGPDTVCEFTDSQYYSTKKAKNHKYRWSINGGNIIDSSAIDSIGVNWDANGKGEVKLTETNENGCDTTMKKEIQINKKPSPVIKGKDTVCELTGDHSYSTNQKDGHKYSWQVKQGNITQGGGTYSIKVYWNNMGKGSIRVQERNTNGCQKIKIKTIEVEARPTPVINLR